MNQWCLYNQPPRQGTSHKRRGNSPCQDMAVVKENDDVIVAVLSDGLGQLEYSGMAAAAITESVSTYLLNEYKQLGEGQFKEEQFKRTILAKCVNAIREYADSSNISMSKMDGTLLFVVLFKDASQFIYGQLGDGAICVVKPHQSFQATSFDDKIKSTSNLTKTVLSRDALAYFNLQICPAVDLMGIFLTTDGLENELYSKAGKVKKQIEWYFNLISNNASSVCINKINNRWDKLTSDEKYGFTDDMSLIAIVRENTEIELPEDANWLCACGNRNRLESTRCEKCGKDFLKVYKGINFKQFHGGKPAFFTKLNERPEEELRILQKYCEYPLEFLKQKSDTVQKNKASATNTPVHEYPIQSLDIQDQGQYMDNVPPQQELNLTSPEQQIAESAKVNNKHKFNSSGKLNILVCLMATFVLGILVHTLFDIVIKDSSKTTADIYSLKIEYDRLLSENSMLFESIDVLSARIAELENKQNVSLPNDYIYYTVSSGDAYIGQLKQGVPNGMGVVYSSSTLLAGYFQNGMKDGDFYYLYDDGHSQICKYENDKLVSETNLPINETNGADTQPKEIETADIKTYVLMYDADVRQDAKRESMLVISLKKGDIIQSYDNVLIDTEGIKWLEITVFGEYSGWIRANQVQENK